MGTFLTILLYGDYAGLVVVFYLCYKWFKKISKSSSSIKQVVDILQKYSKDSMKENYGNLMEEMEKAPYSPIWNKFKRSLFASPSEGVLMTQDPETFYNNQAILEEIPLQTFKAMPGIFTGLGLLGTFVGITQGISGIEFGNIEAMKNGIEVLLGGTKNAFITSVIGLLGALFYNVVDNYIYRPYTKKLATLIDQLNTLFPSKSLEEFLSHQAEQAEEQTDAMRELNGELVGRLEDMFVKLSQSIDVALKNNLKESFTQSLEPVFQDLNQSIDKLGSSAGDTLSKSIEQGAGDQIQGLAVTLQDFQGKMGNMMEVSEQLNAENTARLQGSVEMMVTKLNEAMDANIQKQATTSDASQAAMKQLVEEMNTNLKAALDQMGEAGRTANQAWRQTTEATR